MVLLFLAIVFLLVYASLIFYYWRGWQKADRLRLHTSTQQVFLSVIVPARNEEHNIKALLDAMAAQTFPQSSFELIVVDDYSTDATAQVASVFAPANTRIIRPLSDASSSSKKKAIEAGIQNAKGELIITTDADCLPGRNWLQSVHDYYCQTDASFIAAPVKFSHRRNALEIFQALDFLVLQGITAASVTLDFHSMCNGANLAYKKASFNSVNGFEGIDKVATGDDMLLMHKIRKQGPDKIHYLKTKEAIVTTQPMPSWKSFFMQRKRWASKTFIYDDFRIIAVLGFVYLFNCLFFVLLIVSFFQPFYWWCVLSFWMAKTLIELTFVTAVARFYEEQKLLPYFFFFQPFHMFYTVFVGALSQFGKYEWKGRKTK